MLRMNSLGGTLRLMPHEALARKVLRACARDARTIATVESCTGGLLGAALTAIAGCSSVYLGGWITYSNHLKQTQVGIPARLFAKVGPGAVSEPAAIAMAEGGRQRSGADYCIAITGIAGPDGGTRAKPVGTVWICFASAHGTAARLERFRGTRAQIRSAAVRRALEMLLAIANDVPNPAPQTPRPPAPRPAGLARRAPARRAGTQSRSSSRS
jgi:PncC family amidohydrolase